MDDMTDFFRKCSINCNTNLCMSLSGRPGNFGTRFQNYLYGRMGLDYIYKSFSTTDIGTAINGIRALNVRGCAISMPFKESCIEFLDYLEEAAAGIRSVNTIVNDDGRLIGYNTDYTAVRHLIESRFLNPASIVILRGSGGMGKTVAAAFRDAGFTRGIIVARNKKDGPETASRHGWKYLLTPDDIAPEVYENAILVNVTPLGMSGGEDAQKLSFPELMIQKAGFVFEVVASPIETPLVMAARSANRPLISGDQVAIIQATEQFKLYTGLHPSNDIVREAAGVAMNSSSQ